MFSFARHRRSLAHLEYVPPLFDARHECVNHLMVAYLEKVPFLLQLASPLAHRGGWPHALRYHLLLTYWHRDERRPK